MEKGRPTDYTEELANDICVEISTTAKGLHIICKELGIGYTTVKRWIIEKEEFRAKYVRAKEEQAEHLAEEMLEIADDSNGDTLINDKGEEKVNNEWVQRSRLRIDTRKWIASKLLPKKYGDKLDLTTNGQNINRPPAKAKLPDGTELEI